MLAPQSLLLVAAALSASVFAAPSGADKPTLEARFRGYDCGGTLFTVADAQEALGDATTALRTDVVYHNGASKHVLTLPLKYD